MILRRALLLLLSLLPVSTSACVHSDPLPPVTPAPLSACLTFLLQDDKQLTNAYDRDVQNAVRKAIAKGMVGAGFNVHSDPALPHDLLAELATTPGSRLESGARVKVKLVLTNQGRAVERFEVSTSQESPNYGNAVADQIVDGVFRSAAIARFTRELRKPESEQHLAGGALRAALIPACTQAAQAAQEAQAAQAGVESTAPPPPSAAPPPPPEPGAKSLLVTKPNPGAYAFIVGIDEYKSAPRVHGGVADAERFFQLARKTLGVPESHIKLILGEKADKLAFDLTFEWLKLNVPRGGRVYFYFSGHGALRRQSMTPFLLPRDGDPKALDKTAIPLGAFLQSLAQTKAKDVVAIVDAGLAGAGPRSAPLPDGVPPRTLSDPEVPPHAVLLSAVTSAEAAGVGPEGGIFTRTLMDGVGLGRADIDGDGQLSLQEFLTWAGPRVTREAKLRKGTQTPSIVLGPGTGPAGQFVFVSGLPVQ